MTKRGFRGFYNERRTRERHSSEPKCEERTFLQNKPRNEKYHLLFIPKNVKTMKTATSTISSASNTTSFQLSSYQRGRLFCYFENDFEKKKNFSSRVPLKRFQLFDVNILKMTLKMGLVFCYEQITQNVVFLQLIFCSIARWLPFSCILKNNEDILGKFTLPLFIDIKKLK